MAVAVYSYCIENGTLDDLGPESGLAFGRACGTGIDGRLTGFYSWGLSLRTLPLG